MGNLLYSPNRTVLFFDRLSLFCNRETFTSEERLVSFQVTQMPIKDSPVRGNNIAIFELNDVTGYDFLNGDNFDGSVARAVASPDYSSLRCPD